MHGRVQCMHIIKDLVVILHFNVVVIMGISMKTQHLEDHAVVASDLVLVVQTKSTPSFFIFKLLLNNWGYVLTHIWE